MNTIDSQSNKKPDLETILMELVDLEEKSPERIAKIAEIKRAIAMGEYNVSSEEIAKALDEYLS